MKASSPIYVILFLAVSQSDVNNDVDFAYPFFACSIRGANNIVCPKNRVRRSKFTQSCLSLNLSNQDNEKSLNN